MTKYSQHPKEHEGWVASAKASAPNGVNAFLAAESPTKFSHIGYGACHGNFGGSGYVDYTILWSWKMNTLKNTAQEAEKPFVEWLVNKSPWADVFIDKEYDSICENGHAARTDLPSDYILSGLVASRFFTETHTTWTAPHTHTFADLLKEGVDATDAFLMAIMYKKVGNSYQYQMQSGHEILPQHWSLGTLKAFMEKNYNPKTSLFKTVGGYRTIGTAWTWKNDGPRTSDRAKVWGKVESNKGIDYNIFRRPDPNQAYPQLSLKTLIDLIPTIKQEAQVA